MDLEPKESAKGKFIASVRHSGPQSAEDAEVGASMKHLDEVIEAENPSPRMRSAITRVIKAWAMMWKQEVEAKEEAILSIPEVMVQFESLQAAARGRQKAEKNPAARAKAEAMKAIKAEWERRKRDGTKFRAVAFAKEMAKEYGYKVTIEHLKNCQTQWTKQYHPAG